MAKLEGAAAKHLLKMLAMTGLFLVSFVFFLFMTFPYEVLKESVAAEISQTSGYSVRIGAMSSGFPLGLKCEDVHVEPASGGPALALKLLRADVHPLWLVLGKLAVSAEIGIGPGKAIVGLDFGLLDLLSGVRLPKHFSFEAKNLSLDEAVAFGLGLAANAQGSNPMVAPLLGAIGFNGQLNGAAEFKLDPKNPTQSTGQAEISLAKAVLKLSNPALGLPDQAFKKAVLKAKVDDGRVKVDPSSGFSSDELEITPTGTVTLKPQPSASQLDLSIAIRLNKTLKDKFGFIVDAVTGNPSSEGLVTMHVRGPMDQPAVTTL